MVRQSAGESGSHLGQLGRSSTVRLSSIPVLVEGLNNDVTAIAAGNEYSCAVQNNAAKCWGSSQNGKLGDNTGRDSNTPVRVQGLLGECHGNFSRR